MTDGPTKVSPAPWRLYLLYLLIAAFIALSGIAYLMGWEQYLLERLASYKTGLTGFVAEHFLLALASYAAVYVAAAALSVPLGAFLTIAGGFLFGWLGGGIVAVVSATVGATLLFLIARSSFGDLLSRRAGPFLQKLSAGFRDDAMSYLLFLRLVPAFPFWLVNLAPALLGVSFRTFVIATFLGIIPATFAFSLVGDGLGRAIGGERPHWGIVSALVALAFIALIPVIVRKLKERS